MVIYRGSDGKPGYHQTDDIHDAVGFVESMRNDEGVEQARIFRLEEVVFEYRPYYRVELSSSAPLGSGTAAEVGKGSDKEIESKKDEESTKKASSNDDKSDDSDSDDDEEPKKGLFGR